MLYTIKLNEQQLELLKSIFVQIEPISLIVLQEVKKPKKLSEIEQTMQDRWAYRANKAAKKKR